MKKLIYLSLPLVFLGLAISVAPKQSVSVVKSADTTNTYSILEQEFFGGRITADKSSDATTAGIFGTNIQTYQPNYVGSWQAGLIDKDAAMFRMIVNAPTAGTYTYGFNTFDADRPYIYDIHVNSVANYTRFSNTSHSGGWQKDRLNLMTQDIELNAGLNVVVTHPHSWGHVNEFLLDSDLTLVGLGSVVPGEHNSTEFRYNMNNLIPSQRASGADMGRIPNADLLFNSSTVFEFDTLKQDGSAEWEGFAATKFQPLSTTKSLIVKYEISSYNGTTNDVFVQLNGNAGLKSTSISVGNSTKTAGVGTFVVGNSWLSANGFDTSIENYISFSSRRSNCGIKILGITESNENAPSATEPTPDEGLEGYSSVSAAELKTKVKINGRSLDAPTAIYLDWTASGIEFNFEGSGDIIADFSTNYDFESRTRFVVEIDGELVKYAVPSAKTVLVEGLEDGNHHVKLIKTSEASGALFQLNSLTVKDGSVISKPTAKELKFEIYGDSNSCGSQVVQGGQDGYISYGNLLANAYNADLDVIAVSGRGLFQGFNSEDGYAMSQANQLKDIWDYISFARNQTSKIDLTADQPDVVVLSLGANDLGPVITEHFHNGVAEFVDALINFNEVLRAAYPTTEIIWHYGSYYSDANVTAISNAIDGLDENTNFIASPLMYHGDSGHYNDIDHDIVASIISSKIAEVLDVEDPYVRKYIATHYEAESGILGNGAGTQNKNDEGNANDLFWSGDVMVNGMGSPSNTATNIDNIADDLSNVNYVSIPVNAPATANYTVRFYIACYDNFEIGVRVDTEAWSSVAVSSTGDWSTGHGVYQTFNVKMSAGDHYITLTSALASGWYNLDFIAVIQGNLLPTANVELPDDMTGYQINGLPEELIVGDTATFTVQLESLYSESQIVVTVNEDVVVPDNNGVYTFDVTEGTIVIGVAGVLKNVWNVYYKLVPTGQAWKTVPFEVGETIVHPSEVPTLEGYVFLGWNSMFAAMPNSDIEVVAIWEQVIPDTTAPVVTYNGSLEVRYGSYIALASNISVDDDTAVISYKVKTGASDNAQSVRVVNGGFYANKEITYYVSITATDEAGNVGVLNVEIVSARPVAPTPELPTLSQTNVLILSVGGGVLILAAVVAIIIVLRKFR